MIRRCDSSASVHLDSSYDSRSAQTSMQQTSATNIFDEVLIPLIAESNRSTKSKGIIFAISIFVVFGQIILGSLFCLIENDHVPKTLRKVSEVFFIGYSYDKCETNQRFIMLVILLFSFIALLILIINYKYISHEFSKFSLGFARLWFGDLFSIFLIPSFLYTVSTLIYYGIHPVIEQAFLSFVHVVLLFLCLFITRYFTENLACNIYITSSPMFFWRTRPYYNAIIFYAVGFSSSPLAYIFNNWAKNIPQVLMILLSPLISYNLLNKCFQTQVFNAFAISFPVFTLLGAVMSLINNFVKDFPLIVYYLVPVIGFVISHVVYALFLIHYKDKKIINVLSNNIELTDEEKLQIFDSMKITKQDKCYCLLVGLINKCPLFLNWSLSHYLINKDPEDMELLTFATWLVSFFPSETRIMNSFLSQISKYPYLTFSERCSFFQLHRIYVLRESSSSTSLEAAADFRPVHEQSEKVIAYISNFWRFAASDPEEINDSIFHLISKERRQAETNWTDLLEKYPNNAQMMHEYARFLANGESKFQKAIQSHQKANMMESGQIAKNDKSFKCFLLRFPEYLKRGYVDNKGRLNMSKIMSNKSESTESNDNNKMNRLNDISILSVNSSDSNFTSTTASSNFEASGNSSEAEMFGEKQIDMEEAKSFIKMTELRIAMEKSLEQYRSPVSAKIWVASLARLILSLALCFIIFFIVFFQHPTNEILFQHLAKFNRAFHIYELTTNLYPWSWMAQYTGGEDNEFKFINEDLRYHYTYVNTSSNEITEQIANLSKIILNYIDEFSNNLYSSDSEDSQSNFVQYYSQTMLDSKACMEVEDGIEVNDEPASITMDSLFKTAITVLLKLSSSKPKKKKEWNNKDNYCDMYVQSQVLQGFNNELIASISEPVESLFCDDDISIDFSGGDDESGGGAKLLSRRRQLKQRIHKKKNIKNAQTNRTSNINLLNNYLIKEVESDHNETDHSIGKNVSLRNKRPKIADRIKSFFRNLFSSLKSMFTSSSAKTSSKVNKSKKARRNKLHQFSSNRIKRIKASEDEEESPSEDDPPFIIEGIEEEEEDEDDSLGTLDFFMGFIPFFVALFSFPSLIFLSSSLNKEKEDLISLLIGVNEEEATAASHVVTGKASTSTIQMSSAYKKSYVWLWSSLSLIIVIACLMIIIGMAQMKETQEEIYIQHFSFLILERNYIFDIGRDLFYLLIYVEMGKDKTFLNFKEPDYNISYISSIDELKELLNNDFTYFDSITTLIREGTEEVRQVHGFDSHTDKLRYDDKCEITYYFDHDSYYFLDCISLDRLISYFVGEAKMISSSLDRYPEFNSTEFRAWHSLLITRFTKDYEDLADEYENRFNNKISFFNILTIVLFILSIFSTVVAFLIELFLLIRFHNEIAIFRTLVLRLNPLYFVSNPDLLSTVYKSSKIDKAFTSSSHAMFQTAHDALFILKEDMIIESVNPAATNIFGFTPEQMLGQSIKFILPNDLNSSTYYVVDLMMSGATSLNYESEATGTKDDGSDVPLRLSVIGLTQDKNNNDDIEYDSPFENADNKEKKQNNNKDEENKESDENKEEGAAAENNEGANLPAEEANKERSLTGGKKATAFAFIMKDMTEEQRQKLAVEEAKKKAEVILLQILPKDIIMRLNRGDKEITFTVDSATIIFIDIEKFSQYSSTLSAKDIMLNLSRIFTAFDKICSTFNLITKIKMIGDDYMAAAGLFSPDINPQEHAHQVVQFALQCLEALEEQNVILNASLQVRIGINTDGPVIAGVLGTEKPLFDIIGDPINVAARLQSTCIPGLVQISEGTYKLVANFDYKIEERGEIMLKGKGKRKTFLIYPETHESKNFGEDQDSSAFSSSILQQIVNPDSNSMSLSKGKKSTRK